MPTETTTDIKIECFADGTTKISYQKKGFELNIRQQKVDEAGSLNIIKEILEKINYNQIFSIIPVVNDASVSERTTKEVEQFTELFKTEMKKIPNRNIAIATDIPTDWNDRVAAADKEQREILKEAYRISFKVKNSLKGTPLPSTNLENPSNKELIEAVKYLREIKGKLLEDHVDSEYFMFKLRIYALGLIAGSALVIAITPALIIGIVAGIIGVLVAAGALIYHKINNSKCNNEDYKGIKKLEDISDEFFESLESKNITPAPSAVTLETVNEQKQSEKNQSPQIIPDHPEDPENKNPIQPKT